MLASILAYIVLAVTVFCVTPTFAQLPPSTYEVHDVLSGQNKGILVYTRKQKRSRSFYNTKSSSNNHLGGFDRNKYCHTKLVDEKNSRAP